MICSSPLILAGKTELTTYYPAPYGEYQELTVSNRVGIGTTTPVATLQIGDSTTAIARPLHVEGEVAGGFHTAIFTNSATHYSVGIGGQSTFGSIQAGFGDGVTSTNDVPLVLNRVGGNVGIGTVTPNAKLAVAGKIVSTTGAQHVVTTKSNLSSYHPSCHAGNSFNRGFDLLVCNSACSRYCDQALGYSGGTLVEWGDSTDVAHCDCIP